ncbi:hypothetical protein EW026_g5355 [Hermanssonia centrifuga]|uniref:Uncharacterized protein n=1 Tax=Hermanssonia centrifuga TaxID=98765 RepID=A0A4V3XA29_9APHY|nr:hypothetical protein EW026_g5355 [Hermanssonia centrifuga]
MLFQTALFSALVGLVAGAAQDVWAPPITSPTAASVWPIGSTQNVTWSQTLPAGLSYQRVGYVDVDHPLATGFPLTAGFVLVQVPTVATGTDYAVVSFKEMLFQTALFSALVGLVAGAAQDVWAPPITSPTAASVWSIGSTQNVTWDASHPPSEVTNPIGQIILSKGGVLDVDHPLATGFPLTSGFILVQVPNVVPGNDYATVLIGDSGNASPYFEITV